MSKILIVDDEPDILFTVRTVLEIVGHEVIEAEDGTHALERAWDMPDAIVLDLRLPDVDGFYVLSALKAEPALSHIPVMCLSAHSDANTMERAIECGAAAYVSKPFQIADLRATVQEMLEKRYRDAS
jgi:DNA-binding response OmpR family regulator